MYEDDMFLNSVFFNELDLLYTALELVEHVILGEFKIDNWEVYEDGECGFLDNNEYKNKVIKYLENM